MTTRIDTDPAAGPLLLQIPDLPDGQDPIPEASPDSVTCLPEWVRGGTSWLSATGRTLEAMSMSTASAFGGQLAGLGASIINILGGVACIPVELVDDDRARLLRTALGIYDDTPSVQGITERQARALGAGAVLAGMSDAEIRRMDVYPRDAFMDEVRDTRRFAREHPEEFGEARQVYQEVLRDWQDGLVAGLVGRQPPPGAGPAFHEAYRRAGMVAGQDWTAPARQRATSSINDGFIDGARGHVDRRRSERDAAYRLGIADARAMRESEGAGAVREHAAELRQQRTESQRATERNPVRG
jgi:hypothetical protein